MNRRIPLTIVSVAIPLLLVACSGSSYNAPTFFEGDGAKVLEYEGWPDCLAGGNWKEALAAFTQAIGAHSIDFREKLLGANAARLYKVLT